MASLLPPGVSSINELPWDLALAIDHATRVCSWQENLFGEDMPPDWMWPFDRQLESWFHQVDQRRGNEASGDETVPMVDNELSARFRRD